MGRGQTTSHAFHLPLDRTGNVGRVIEQHTETLLDLGSDVLQKTKIALHT
jgi:hypothetical protein